MTISRVKLDAINGAVHNYAWSIGTVLKGNERDVIVDLLTDLRHWCDRQGLEFAEIRASSEGHYHYEVHQNDTTRV